MHPESMEQMKYFREKYVTKGMSVLDVGSRAIDLGNPIYRDLFPDCYYIGVDSEPGRNVDVEGLENIREVFDVVISGQTLEHVRRPWDWLKSLVPLFTKYICIIAPHTFQEHRFPLDTYRYFPDGMRDLFEYASIKELEIFRDKVDTVGIGTK